MTAAAGLVFVSDLIVECGYIFCICIGVGAYGPVDIQMDPPQIATEGFSSDSLSKRSPEQHTKNVKKSIRTNIIFSGKIKNGS